MRARPVSAVALVLVAAACAGPSDDVSGPDPLATAYPADGTRVWERYRATGDLETTVRITGPVDRLGIHLGCTRSQESDPDAADLDVEVGDGAGSVVCPTTGPGGVVVLEAVCRPAT